MSTPRLVLASNSRYRKELLARLEVPFEVAAPRFDEAAERHGVEKIKTIGDAYMAAAGLPKHQPAQAEAMLMG